MNLNGRDTLTASWGDGLMSVVSLVRLEDVGMCLWLLSAWQSGAPVLVYLLDMR